jgi:hypothetical protein
VCDQDVEVERERQGRHDGVLFVPEQRPLPRDGLQREEQKSRRRPSPRQKDQDARPEQHEVVVPGDR